MRAIVFHQHGGPEVLNVEERPQPEPREGEVVVAVKAFGVNRAETHMRAGSWSQAAPVSGIECVGEVVADPSGRLAPGTTVAALLGGMGWSVEGSYAEFTRVRAENVVPLSRRTLSWAELAAIPESYVTAWTALVGILGLEAGQTVLIRGATSALGRAAVNIAVHVGAQVIATTRKAERAPGLEALGASVMIEGADLAGGLRARHPQGVDAVLDIVGNTTILESLSFLKRGGRACLVGFLGGGGPLMLEPVFQIPSGVHLSVLATALVTGTPAFPLSEIPLQEIVDRVAAGTYKAAPARIFAFDEIAEAHRLMESDAAGGKIVVVL